MPRRLLNLLAAASLLLCVAVVWLWARSYRPIITGKDVLSARFRGNRFS